MATMIVPQLWYSRTATFLKVSVQVLACQNCVTGMNSFVSSLIELLVSQILQTCLKIYIRLFLQSCNSCQQQVAYVESTSLRSRWSMQSQYFSVADSSRRVSSFQEQNALTYFTSARNRSPARVNISQRWITQQAKNLPGLDNPRISTCVRIKYCRVCRQSAKGQHMSGLDTVEQLVRAESTCVRIKYCRAVSPHRVNMCPD